MINKSVVQNNFAAKVLLFPKQDEEPPLDLGCLALQAGAKLCDVAKLGMEMGGSCAENSERLLLLVKRLATEPPETVSAVSALLGEDVEPNLRNLRRFP